MVQNLSSVPKFSYHRGGGGGFKKIGAKLETSKCVTTELVNILQLDLDKIKQAYISKRGKREGGRRRAR